MADIENVGYPCVQLRWIRKKGKPVFKDLKEIANNFEVGVDEDRKFYFRAIDTTVQERYWIGKGVKFFEPKQESDSIVNSYDVLVGQMNSGNNYLLTVSSTASQDSYGIRKDNLLLNEAILGFGSELATGITPTTNPAVGTPANMTDGNTATEWDSGTNQLTSHYIDIDLGALKSYLGKVRLDSSSATDKATTFADRFKILVSTTGSFSGEETQVYASTEDLGTADKIVTFVPTAGRYIRIQITQNKAAHWHVDELEIYEWNVADITRWATEKLNDKKDPIRRGVLELESCSKRIWPRGKIRVTSLDGTSYFDYPHVATSVHVGANLKLQTRLELGEVKRDIGDEILANRRMLKEYSIAGLSRDSDLASGSAIQGGKIIHTHIGKSSIESPMVKTLAILAQHLSVDQLDAISANIGTLTVGTITTGISIGGSLRKIYDRTLTGIATSVTLSSLTGDTALHYFVSARWVKNATADCNFGVQLNADAGVSNYGWFTIFGGIGDGSSANGYKDDTFFMLWMGRAESDDYISQGDAWLQAGSGFPRSLKGVMSMNVGGSVAGGMYVFSDHWWNTADEITAMTFLAELASGLNVGTRLEVWERVD